MLNLEVVCDQIVLCTYIVVKRDLGERVWEWCIRGRGRLSISKEGRDNDEVLIRVKFGCLLIVDVDFLLTFSGLKVLSLAISQTLSWIAV